MDGTQIPSMTYDVRIDWGSTGSDRLWLHLWTTVPVDERWVEAFNFHSNHRGRLPFEYAQALDNGDAEPAWIVVEGPSLDDAAEFANEVEMLIREVNEMAPILDRVLAVREFALELRLPPE